MTTTEYLKQRGIELLDFFGIKPTSSLVIKTLRGEVLGIEHQLSEANEKEFLTSFLKGKPEIPAVQIERVQFPNDLRGRKATDLENRVRSNQANDYNREKEYVLDTNLGITFSQKDWEKQCWKPDTPTLGQYEYLITVRDKSTPERNIIGHSTHFSEKELEVNQEAFSKFQDIESKDVVIETYKIYNSDDPEYQKAKSGNLQRYVDDPRNKVDLLKTIDVSETVLVYTNENDKTNELYSGNNMLMDFYNKNFDKSGTVYLCTTSNLPDLEYSLQNSIPFKDITDTKIEKQLFAPEFNFYIQDCLKNHMDIKNSILPDDTIADHSLVYFADYRKFLNEHNITDIERSRDYICQAIIQNAEVLSYLTDSEKPDVKMWKEILESPISGSCISIVPKEYITFDFLRDTNYYEPKKIYKYLPENITNEQIMNLIAKDSNIMMDERLLEYFAPSSINNCIKYIPEEFKNKDFVSALHRYFSDTPAENEVAYSIVTQGLEKPNNFTALKAMDYFRENRFITEYDPIGADDAWGQLCGCDWYINTSLANPADKFDPNLLTIKQWHDIASQDTRMLEFIPESIIKEEAFWENYQDFIGKGGYLNHPDNEYRMDKFDEYQVFSKMPEQLKTNPDICLDLLEKKAVSISFIKNPTEDHYLLVNPQDYDRIPLDLREKDSFKDLALKAFNIEKWNILHIPEKFITQEMVSEALSHDMELCNRIPIHYLSEELLCNKIKNYKHQGAFSEINRSGEHPQYIEYELSNHKKVLQYVPEELKTDLVCQAALKANPENAAFLPKNHLNNNTMNDLKIENLHLRELNKDEIDILHKIQMSGRVVDSGISEGNKDLIDKYFSQDNKELITAIKNDDSGMIADIEGRRRLTAGEILESRGIIPDGTTAKTLEEEGYKVELLKSKINSKTENHLGVDKTNMKTVNNNAPMTEKKQSVPLNTLGEVKTAQKSQGKTNTNPTTGNILHSYHKDKLSNSNKISKSHTNISDSNRKRRSHKL